MRKVNLFTENFFLRGRLRNFVKKIFNRQSLGPLKMQTNLVKGLNKLSIEVAIDKLPILPAQALCVLRGERVVENLVRRGYGNITLGPNLTAKSMAKIYDSHKHSIRIILAPSPEVKVVYMHFGIPEEKIAVWPVGIDTEDFPDVATVPKIYDAMLYFKRRTRAELNQAVKLLESKKQKYKVLEYGNYTEIDFKNALQNCRYAVVLDGTESQGIALEEIMSSNLPMFVFDQVGSSDPWERENLRVTSVPYWSNICGTRIATDMFGLSKQPFFSISETSESFSEFLHKLSEFNPRKYILENLELVAQAKNFLKLVG